jgi:hypothetical protein
LISAISLTVPISPVISTIDGDHLPRNSHVSIDFSFFNQYNFHQFEEAIK